MRDRDMHRVRIIVRYIFPVDLAQSQRHPPKRLEFLESIASQFLLIRRQHLRDAGCARLQTNEDESFVDFDLERLQPVMLRRKVDEFPAMRHGNERPVEIVSPSVVRTNNASGAMPGSTVEQPGGAMAADVEKSLDAVIAAAHRDNGFAEEVQRVVVPRRRNVAEVADDLPRRRKNLLFFRVQKLGVPIYPSGQTEVFFHRSASRIHPGRFLLLLNGSITRARFKFCEEFPAKFAARRLRKGR